MRGYTRGRPRAGPDKGRGARGFVERVGERG